MKRSDDQLKSNIKGSHINNECNDGRDNEPEHLGEDCSYLTLKNKCDKVNTKNVGSWKAHIRTLTYKHTQ